MTHGSGSFPYLTLAHVHSDECCGIDDHGKPAFICNYEFNACTTCMATGSTNEEMRECVSQRKTKMRKESKGIIYMSTVDIGAVLSYNG